MIGISDAMLKLVAGIGAVIVLVLLGAVVWLGMANLGLRADLATAEKKLSELKAEYAAASAEATEKQRVTDRAWLRTVETARGEADVALSKVSELEKQLVVVRSDRDRLDRTAVQLRKQADLARAASPADDTLAACQSRAAGYYDLLARGFQHLVRGAAVVERSAGVLQRAAVAAETRGVKLTACINGWPRDVSAAAAEFNAAAVAMVDVAEQLQLVPPEP